MHGLMNNGKGLEAVLDHETAIENMVALFGVGDNEITFKVRARACACV